MVASETLTKSGPSDDRALIAGERDPEVLAPKIGELVGALDGRFADHHAVHLRQLLDHIDWLEAAIVSFDDRIVLLCRPWAQLIELLQTIPGVGQRTAEVLVAETGGDMSVFPTAGHLALWVGLCPGHNASAGKHRCGKTRKGNPWLAQALTEPRLGRRPYQGHLPGRALPACGGASA